jgi:hypothetical protein
MSLLDLIDSGKIQPGTKICYKTKGVVHCAEILEDGHVKDENGNVHKSLSGAARAFNGNKPVDGWLAWKLEEQPNVSLHSLR